MKVKRLKMQSFRGISDLTLDFDPTEPTVLMGINGSGKSSILDCLAICLSSCTIPAGILSANSLDSLKLLDYERLKGNTMMGLVFPQNEERFKQSFAEKDIRTSENQTSNEALLSFDSEDLTFLIQKFQGIPLEFKDVQGWEAIARRIYQQAQQSLDSKGQLNLPIAVYYRVNRAVSGVPLDVIDATDSAFNPFSQFISGGQANFDSFFKWFRSIEDLENEERRENAEYRNPQLEATRQAIYSLQPGFENLQVRRRSPVRMTVNKQGQELTINQLSEGEKTMLALAGDLARRLAIANPSLANPLQGEGIVLIDEIELHLHPQWQRGIVPKLTQTFPNCQFIITTHSPQVISDVKHDNIYILESTLTGIIASHPQYSFGRDTNQILEDLMDTSSRGGESEQIQTKIQHLYQLIALGSLDKARNLHDELANAVGRDEPKLVGARTAMKRREVLDR
jgi:predicted ATP-binding protein involved in virulence